MSRRRALRRPRRVQVNFWKQGEPTSYIGYTTNISMTGMFIATNSPMPSGVRIRIEVVDRDRGFMVEGMVAHARKIRGELARLSQSGMGVRFLSVEELVRELIPAAVGQTEEIPRDPDRGSVSPSENLAGEPEPPLEHAAPPPPIPTPAPVAPPPEPMPFEPFPPAAAAPFRPEKPAAAPVTASGGSFSVSFSSTDEFMEVYRRDILQGGLFVSTRYPARLQETVLVELHPPIPTAEPLTVRARVVQRFEPSSDPYASPNLLSGMGLELLDLPLLVEKLQPVMRLLRG
jgi:Tfp pilus assembly protein PilZ